MKPGGSHSLVVFATSDLRSGKQTAGKQSLQYASHSCDYTRTTGIWQTVWMEAVAPEALARVQMTTDIDQQQLIVAPQFFRESPNTLRVTLRDGGKVVGTRQVRASNSSVVVIPVKKARLWSPEDPFLYDLTYEVVAPDGQVLDAVKSYVGMRKVHIEGNKIYLNNEPYYQRLVLDQGFYPDGIWTAPSDDALRRDIELGLAAGRTRELLGSELGREATVNEVAERMGRAPEDVAQALAATTPPLSLTGGEEDGSGQIDLPEEGPEERLSDLLSLQQLLSSLEERDRQLIFLRYYRRKTQTEVARRLGMTQVQVSRREKRILQSMRQQLLD